jgi:hypothetical protein
VDGGFQEDRDVLMGKTGDLRRQDLMDDRGRRETGRREGMKDGAMISSESCVQPARLTKTEVQEQIQQEAEQAQQEANVAVCC